MIVGFTGTIAGPTPAQHARLKWFAARLPISRAVHGGCKGVDSLAHNAVRRAHPDIVIEIWPSDLPGTHGVCLTMPMGRCELYPELPPLERNRIIVRRIHGLLAAPRTDREELRSGTWATVRYAREIGCPVYVIQQNGAVVRDKDPVFE
jgi:hypothetical protein